jgi:hypothetical protein
VHPLRRAFIIGEGILGTNVLADSAALIVDVSDVVNSVTTKRGRNPQTDEFQTGTLTLRIVDQNGDFNPKIHLARILAYLDANAQGIYIGYYGWRYLSHVLRLYYQLYDIYSPKC